MKRWKGWVITGGASSGKTSLIEGLRKRDYVVVEEISTAMIREGWHPLEHGREVFQQELLRRQLQAEAETPAGENETVFLDRGLLDGAAFFILDQLAVPKDFYSLDLSHYAGVIVVEHPGHWEENGIRFENLDFALKYQTAVAEVYRNIGLPIFSAPSFIGEGLPKAIERRVDFVLSCVSVAKK